MAKKKTAGGAILVAKTSAFFRVPDGNIVRLRKGRTTIREGHPYLRGREHMFIVLKPTFDLDGIQPLQEPEIEV